MDGELSLDIDLIEEHYESLVSSTEECKESVTVSEDTETTLSVKDESLAAYEESCDLEALVKDCINADAENLSKLGRTFLTLDENLSDDINNLVEY